MRQLEARREAQAGSAGSATPSGGMASQRGRLRGERRYKRKSKAGGRGAQGGAVSEAGAATADPWVWVRTQTRCGSPLGRRGGGSQVRPDQKKNKDSGQAQRIPFRGRMTLQRAH